MHYVDLYHILNRGVENRNLFLNSSDYIRFVHNLYEFNDANPAPELARRKRSVTLPTNVGFTKSHIREKIIDIHAWCLMKNHYHLLLSERAEGGLSLFLRKLNVGYANYFNERYERSGTLFQGRTKKIFIEKNAHFNYIFHYIHLNPLDYLAGAKGWRIRSKGEIKNAPEALEYLKKYRWSSYLDYIGEKNFPSLLTTSIFKETFKDYEKAVSGYLDAAESNQENRPALSLE